MSERLTVLDATRLRDSLAPSAKKLGERLGLAAVQLFAGRVAQALGTPDRDTYSHVWRSAIEEHEQDTHDNSARSAFVNMVRDAALGAVTKGGDDANATAKILLESEYPTLVRVGIYVCGQHYTVLAGTFWDCFKSSWLGDVDCWHEIFWLVKKAFPRFNLAERAKFLAAVQNFKGDWNDKARQEEFDETQKRDILHAAYGAGDDEVDRMYQELVNKWGPSRDHTDFHVYSTSGWAGERGPSSPDALLAMSDEQLVSYLRGFIPDKSDWNGSTYRGLAAQLAAAVRASEDGFAKKIPLFADLPRPYQHGLLSGLRDWREQGKKEVNWKAAVELIEAIVKSPTLLEDIRAPGKDGFEPTVGWVIGDIAWLAKSATEGKYRPSNDLFVRLLRALIHVLEVMPPNPVKKAEDSVSNAINVPRGKTIEAVIQIAVALRHNLPESDATWTLVGPCLDAELATSEVGNNADFAALAGTYCTNLHFLSPDWVEQNFDRIFSTKNDAAWQCAAHGFAYQTQVQRWLYRKLVDGGHLQRMVVEGNVSREAHEKAVQFVAVAYLHGDEPLTGNGILAGFVDSLSSAHLSKICWLFWTFRSTDGNPSPHAQKIIEFWKRVSAVARESGEEHPEVQSSLNYLAPFVGELEPETVQIWAEAAPYANVNYNGHVLLEYLAPRAKSSPKEVVTIFDAALTRFLPDFTVEDLNLLVGSLAEAGLRDQAEAYCDHYASKGSQVLRPLYESLRKRD